MGRMSNENELNGHYLTCPKCNKRISKKTDYEFEDVYSDLYMRDVIKFLCLSCGNHVESFVHVVRNMFFKD